MEDGDLDVLDDFLLRVSVCAASGQRGTEGPIASVLFRQHDGVGIGIHRFAPPFDPASSSGNGSPMKRSGKHLAPRRKPLRRKGQVHTGTAQEKPVKGSGARRVKDLGTEGRSDRNRKYGTDFFGRPPGRDPGRKGSFDRRQADHAGTDVVENRSIIHVLPGDFRFQGKSASRLGPPLPRREHVLVVVGRGGGREDQAHQQHDRNPQGVSAYGCQDHRSEPRTQGVQLPSGTPPHELPESLDRPFRRLKKRPFPSLLRLFPAHVKRGIFSPFLPGTPEWMPSFFTTAWISGRLPPDPGVFGDAPTGRA